MKKQATLMQFKFILVSFLFWGVTILALSPLVSIRNAYPFQLKTGEEHSLGNTDLQEFSSPRCRFSLMSSWNKPEVQQLRKILITENKDYLKYIFGRELAPEYENATLLKEKMGGAFDHWVKVTSEASGKNIFNKTYTQFVGNNGIYYMITDKVTKQAIGYISIHGGLFVESPPEIGIYITEAASGKGYGTEATSALINQVRDHLIDTEIIWECHRKNISSRKIAEKNGFKLWYKSYNMLVFKRPLSDIPRERALSASVPALASAFASIKQNIVEYCHRIH